MWVVGVWSLMVGLGLCEEEAIPSPASPALHRAVRLVFRDKGAHRSPDDGPDLEASGVLLSQSGWPSVENDAVPVQCEERECRPLLPTEVSDWVAVLHFPRLAPLRDTTVALHQIRQAVLWGASAVILLAFHSDTIANVDLRKTYIAKPVVLITSNITTIMRALANSTRVLVSMSREVRGEEGGVSTLTLWATCGRQSSYSSTIHDGKHWEGTVCLEAEEAGENVPSETQTLLTLSAVASLLCLLLHTCGLRPEGSEEGGGFGRVVRDQWRRRSLARRLEAVWRLGAEEWEGEWESDACAICLEDYVGGDMVRSLACGHRLHRHCLDPWLLQADSCPLCKRRVLIPSRFLPF